MRKVLFWVAVVIYWPLLQFIMRMKFFNDPDTESLGLVFVLGYPIILLIIAIYWLLNKNKHKVETDKQENIVPQINLKKYYWRLFIGYLAVNIVSYILMVLATNFNAPTSPGYEIVPILFFPIIVAISILPLLVFHKLNKYKTSFFVFPVFYIAAILALFYIISWY